MEVLALILLILLTALCISGVLVAILTNLHSNSFKEVKKLVKQDKDVAPFYLDYCYKREKAEIEKLLEEHNYKLIKKTIKEERVVYGCGEVEFADGSHEYHVYFSKHCFSPTTERDYKSLKKELGKKATFISSVEKVYTNKETE